MSITSERIKQARKEKGLTMDELANKMGVKSQRTVVNWENGSTSLSEKKLSKIASILEVSVLYLLGYIDTPKEELMTFDSGEEFDKTRQQILDKINNEQHTDKKKGINLLKMFEEMKKNDFQPTVHSADYEMSEDEIEEIKRIEEERQAEQEKYEDTVNLYFKEIAKRLDTYEKEMIVELYRLNQENQDKVRRYIYALNSDNKKD
ncbi:helix-turn-helix domain-containing protein [Pseudolactococcus piscium]